MAGKGRGDPRPANSAKNQDSYLFPFMNLPPELRNKIYRYLLPTTAIPATRNGFIEGQSEDPVPCHPAILRVSRLVHDEAFGILCEKLKFGVDVDETGVFIYGGCQLPGWKQCKRPISDFASAKEHLGNHWDLFTKAYELHIQVTGSDRYDCHSWLEYGGPPKTTEVCNESHVNAMKDAYDTKDNVLLLADLIRETGFWRKEQGLPMLRVIAVGDVDGGWGWGDCSTVENAYWYLRPLENMRVSNLAAIYLGDIEKSAFLLHHHKCYDEFTAWTDKVRKLAAGTSALPRAPLNKQHMYTQLDRLVEFMRNLNFENDMKAVWEEYYCARHAFDLKNKKGFEAQMRNVVAVWRRILEARREQETRAAVSFAALVGDLPKE